MRFKLALADIACLLTMCVRYFCRKRTRGCEFDAFWTRFVDCIASIPHQSRSDCVSSSHTLNRQLCGYGSSTVYLNLSPSRARLGSARLMMKRCSDMGSRARVPNLPSKPSSCHWVSDHIAYLPLARLRTWVAGCAIDYSLAEADSPVCRAIQKLESDSRTDKYGNASEDGAFCLQSQTRRSSGASQSACGNPGNTCLYYLVVALPVTQTKSGRPR